MTSVLTGPSNRSDLPCVLVADDDDETRLLLKTKLEEIGCRVIVAADGQAAKQSITEQVSVVVLDLNMPAATGFECLVHFRERFPDTQVIVLSASRQTRDIAQAMRLGAFWYLNKGSGIEDLPSLIEQAHKHGQVLRENRELRKSVWDIPTTLPEYVHESTAGRLVFDEASRAARSATPILITGASGTGKSLIARHIHELSGKSERPFLVVNCAGTPAHLLEEEVFGAFEPGSLVGRPGKLELAAGGTVLFDEIGDLPLELQPRLFSVLQDRSFVMGRSGRAMPLDVRILATSNQDLVQKSEEGAFRQDLYFRLAVLTLSIPPLRERRDDVLALAERYLARFSQRSGRPISLSEAAKKAMVSYRWPGNVRELENVLERACTLSSGTILTPDSLSLTTFTRRTTEQTSLAGFTLDEIERRAIRETLGACNGNKALAARTLGISERSIYNKLARLDAETPPAENSSE